MAKGKYQEWLEPDGLLLLSAWARDGLTGEQIAKKMAISYSTFKLWKEKYSAISAALKKGKEVVDIEVENSLLKRAKGYSYEEITQELITVENEDGDKHKELAVTKIVKKEVLPDVTAQIIWLKNRKPREWRDKIDPSTVDPNKTDDGFVAALEGKATEAWGAGDEE